MNYSPGLSALMSYRILVLLLCVCYTSAGKCLQIFRFLLFFIEYATVYIPYHAYWEMGVGGRGWGEWCIYLTGRWELGAGLGGVVVACCMTLECCCVSRGRGDGGCSLVNAAGVPRLIWDTDYFSQTCGTNIKAMLEQRDIHS